MSEPTFGGGGKKLSKNRKIALFAVGGVLGIGGILWWRSRQNAAGSNTANTSTTDPNAIDPNTGIPYADESGYGAVPGALGSYDPNTGTYGPGIGIPPIFNPTNATWDAEATTYLVGLGYNPVTVADALGLYLAGQPLSQNEYDIVTAAIGAEGNPPNGAPPPTLSGGGGGGQGGGTGPTVKVPNIVGSVQVTAGIAITAKGLKFHPIHDGQGAVGTSWIVSSQSPNAGSNAKIGSTVTAHLHPRKPDVDKKPKPPKRKIGPIRRGTVGINPGA